MKSMQQKFLDTYVEDSMYEQAHRELVKIMFRCWLYGINGGGYRSFRHDFNLEKQSPESEKELKI